MIAFVQFLMTTVARLYLRRYRPRVIGVTGNTGKTSTRDAIAAVLRTRYRVRTARVNLNTPLGIAATILGAPLERYEQRGGTPGFWLGAFFGGIGRLIRDPQPPDVVVLEYGADAPGDIKRLARLFPPSIAVVTQVGPVPVHVEFFASPEHVAQEKSQLVRALPASGTAVLNGDDLTVLGMRDATHAGIVTFGLGEGATVRATDIHIRLTGERPVGVSFNLTFGSATMPVSIRGTLGRGSASAAAAAIAVGTKMGIGLADACEAISAMVPPPGRLRLIDGIKDSLIVDDTYNASPAATHLAIETIRDLPGRKVVVLGDMLELGRYSVQAHQEAGNIAAEVADELVCVGERARFIADAALNQMVKERVHRFESSRDAAVAVQGLVRSGDVILVKGSQGIRMERVVREIMAEPERASGLLVRQSKRWLEK